MLGNNRGIIADFSSNAKLASRELIGKLSPLDRKRLFQIAAYIQQRPGKILFVSVLIGKNLKESA